MKSFQNTASTVDSEEVSSWVCSSELGRWFWGWPLPGWPLPDWPRVMLLGQGQCHLPLSSPPPEEAIPGQQYEEGLVVAQAR